MFTGSSTLNIDPYQTFVWCFFSGFFEKNLEPSQWIGNIISISCTGWPISDIQRGSRFHMIMGWLCQRYQPNSGSFQGWDWWDVSNNKKNLVSGFHPVSPSRKIFGWTSELWRFPRSWGSHGGIHQRLGYPHDYGNLNPFGTTSARTLPLAQETGHRAANRRRHWGWPTSRPHGSRGLNTQLPCEWEDRVLNHQILANHVFRHSHVMDHLS